MEKQLILTVGREFGSAGHEIAEKLAKHFNVPLYDKNLLKEVLDDKGVQSNEVEKYDESHKKIGIYRSVRGLDSSPETIIANMQFEFLQKKAERGESFVVVGRCAESILKDHPAMISIFILGNAQDKKERIIRLYKISSDEAEKLRKEKDAKRKKYHNTYCEGKWGDSRNYDISINSSKLGVEKTLQMLIEYINERRSE